MNDVSPSRCEYRFGSFRYIPAEQLLVEGETPVRVGARALELLHALVESSGDLVGKDELMARIWPDTSVTESNLKVQVATLRRALGEGREGARYVATANGRGYRFVAPVERHGAVRCLPEAKSKNHHNLPPEWVPVLGREGVVEQLREELSVRRFVTLVGPGGIGKTTVALTVARALTEDYADGVRLVELAALRDSALVPGAITTALGPDLCPSSDPHALPSVLRDKRVLLIFDCCEHLVAATAAVAEEIVMLAPGVNLLATSREPLRAKGEAVHRLEPLAVPPANVPLTAKDAIAFPAIQLFLQRAASAQHGFELSDANAPVIAEVCRRLDGIALAIELAARRMDGLAPAELLSRLSERFALLTSGRRTDLPRHQTLQATIDWSYDLLSEGERTLLRRLSIFQGNFLLESAVAVAQGETTTAADVAAGLGNLVAKSLVVAEAAGDRLQYRLLDSTRVYARGKLVATGELSVLARRHAEHFSALFRRAEAEWERRSGAAWQADYARSIDEVRAALDWAFSPEGDAELGAALTAVSAPLWIRLSLVDECRRHMERALAASWNRLSDEGRTEMKLSSTLGSALLQTRGPVPRVKEAWRTAAAIAERLGDRSAEIQALWGLCDDHTWRGEHRAALAMTRRIRTLATDTKDRAAEVNVGRQAGTALRYLGQLAAARDELEHMLDAYVEPPHGSSSARFQVDPRIAARGTLANVLWLKGYADEAIVQSRQALVAAKATKHALALCNAYAHTAIPIALYVGDWENAERWLAEFSDHSARHAMPVWDAVGRCLGGILEIAQGQRSGLALLRQALDDLADTGFRMRFPAYLGALASGLGSFGRLAEARSTIEEALAWCDKMEEIWCKPELLRIKGELHCGEGLRSAPEVARACFEEAIALSGEQGSLQFERRALASLARLRHPPGCGEAVADPLPRWFSAEPEDFDVIEREPAGIGADVSAAVLA